MVSNTQESRRYYKLAELAKEYGFSQYTLRREALRGNLRFVRATASSNAPIMIRRCDIEHWVAECASKRLRVPAPSEKA